MSTVRTGRSNPHNPGLQNTLEVSRIFLTRRFECFVATWVQHFIVLMMTVKHVFFKTFRAVVKNYLVLFFIFFLQFTSFRLLIGIMEHSRTKSSSVQGGTN